MRQPRGSGSGARGSTSCPRVPSQPRHKDEIEEVNAILDEWEKEEIEEIKAILDECEEEMRSAAKLFFSQ